MPSRQKCDRFCDDCIIPIELRRPGEASSHRMHFPVELVSVTARNRGESRVKVRRRFFDGENLNVFSSQAVDCAAELIEGNVRPSDSGAGDLAFGVDAGVGSARAYQRDGLL